MYENDSPEFFWEINASNDCGEHKVLPNVASVTRLAAVRISHRNFRRRSTNLDQFG